MNNFRLPYHLIVQEGIFEQVDKVMADYVPDINHKKAIIVTQIVRYIVFLMFSFIFCSSSSLIILLYHHQSQLRLSVLGCQLEK